MVAALGPGKFYGSSLPRPRFYGEVKLSSERIDPPLPVMEALMSWAEAAHWSMGGASTTRRRFQGRIEGNANKLRVQREALFKKSGNQPKSVSSSASMVIKRRRVVRLVDDDEREEQRGTKGGAARELGQIFEWVAGKSEGRGENNGGSEGGRAVADPIVVEAESRKVNKKSDERQPRPRVTAVVAGIRNSPRLAKIGRSS